MKSNKPEKSPEKRRFWLSCVGAVLLILAGILLLFRPDFGSATLSLIVGWALILISGGMLIYSLFFLPSYGWMQLLLSAVFLGLGIYIVCNPLFLASILGMVLGIWLAIQGAVALRSAYLEKKLGFSATFSLILGLLMVIFGIVLIFVPLTTSRILMILVGISLILFGGAKLIVCIRFAKEEKEHPEKPDIIDADE